MSSQEQYMQRCLQLAATGAGQAAPNPMVGAVLVYKDRIIGEGYHEKYGKAHAEVNCINNVAENDKTFISGSTMYVSLEPCAHFGKTPPCTNLIIENKIPNVVIGCRDSFSEVNGKGIEKLKEAGIQVTVGVLEKECLELNKRFFTFHNRQRPYIILKWAQSSDGKIAAPLNPPEGGTLEPAGAGRLLISNEFSNRLVHKWRSEEAAILVGTNTAWRDDPSLTTRLWPGQDPVRLVIDKELKLPSHLKLFNGNSETIVFNYIKKEDSGKLHYHQLNRQDDLLIQLLAVLYEKKIQSVLVEGGAKLLQSFIDAGLWDEARIICNEELAIGNGLNAPVLKHQLLISEEKIDTDTISVFVKEMVDDKP
ncbi:MAG TPA: bifunctional diaminohydroxyphosphoribosylaminopyrimidine deaminase/5-amino-6-(5-phosphoribosylamino)uracil reductase RibD [Ferruginibacter sp.]|nr:bifunctional diaminohydroxyphosphoribosylaminopyrimidine deaminase/5-amino-6-(5-phosphoribosylamino)uracil reductase RibD [Ferruginibacter sp.]